MYTETKNGVSIPVPKVGSYDDKPLRVRQVDKRVSETVTTVREL